MNITFIGTGTMGSTQRANTSILIDNLLFDCGMGTIKQLERLDKKVKDLDYIIITHFHADHFFDLPNLIIGKKIRNELDKKVYIIGPTGIREKVYDMMSFSFGDLGSLEEYANLEFIELHPDEKKNIGDYVLTAFELEHGKSIPNYGYLLEKSGKCVGYTGDTSICDNYYKMCEKADYMFADATTILETKFPHMSVSELIKDAEKYLKCKFFAIHRHDYIIPKINKVKFPNDGDKIEI